MNFLDITVDNISLFLGVIDPEALENIGRRFYRGLAAVGAGDPESSAAEGPDTPENPAPADAGRPEILAAAVWQMKFVADEKRLPEAKLYDLFYKDEEAGLALLSEYGRRVRWEYGRRSVFAFPHGKAEGILPVLEAAGFSVREAEGKEISFPFNRLKQQKFMEKKDIPSNIKALDELPKEEFARGIAECVGRSKRALLADLTALPKDWYEPLTSCFAWENGKPSGFLLVHRTPAGRFRVKLLSAFGRRHTERTLLSMLRFSIGQAAKQYPDETKVVVFRRDGAARQLTDYLLPGIKGDPVLFGERSE